MVSVAKSPADPHVLIPLRWNRVAQVMAVGLVLLIAARWHAYQWDFNMFCGAARDWEAGLDPYKGVGLSFYHPPLLLHAYRPFAHLPAPAGYELWLALKVLALLALLVIWNRHFLRLRPDWPTIAFFLLAFNGALYTDLASGNVSLFEQMGIWLGFAFLVRGKPGWCALCLILAAQWKGMSILLACALLVEKRPHWGWFVACMAGFVALFSLNALLHPGLFRRFLQVAPMLDERGPDNPSLLACMRDIIEGLGKVGRHLPAVTPTLLYGILAGGVLLVSFRALLRYRREAEAVDMQRVIYVLCFTLALISPRFKLYSFILVLPPTLDLLRRSPHTLVPLAAVFVFALTNASLLPFRDVFGLLQRYLSLAALLFFWRYALDELHHPQPLTSGTAIVTPKEWERKEILVIR